MKILLIGGIDAYSAQNKLEEVLQRAHSKGMSHKSYYADEIESLNSVQELAGSASLFGGENIVVIRNLLSDGTNQLRESFLDFLAKSSAAESSDDIVVVLFERGNIDKRTKLYKLLVKLATTYDYKEKSTQEKADFIKQLLSDQKIDLRTDLRKELIIILERLDLMTIANEVSKLQNVKIDDLDTLKSIVTAKPTEQVWELLQLSLRNKSEAIRLLDQLLLQQVQPIQLVGYLANELHNLLSYYAGGKFPPFINKRLNDVSRYINREKLGQNIEELFELDLDLKTKSIDPRISLANYLIHL